PSLHVSANLGQDSSSERKKIYIITAPHSTCPPSHTSSTGHPCDSEAGSNAELLHKLLDHSLLYRKPLSERAKGDLNRHETWNDPWRVKLRELVQSSTCEGVIDVHGFPPESSQYDYYFISQDPNAEFENFLSRYVYQQCAEVGIYGPEQALKGLENSIMIDALQFKSKVILIEIREGLSDYKKRKLLEALAQGVKKF